MNEVEVNTLVVVDGLRYRTSSVDILLDRTGRSVKLDGDRVSEDHPHVVATVEVVLGDTINVDGHEFVVTSIRVTTNQVGHRVITIFAKDPLLLQQERDADLMRRRAEAWFKKMKKYFKE